MANYYTQFSTALDVGRVENALLALELFQKEPETTKEIDWSNGFNLSLANEPGSSTLYLDDGGTSDLEALKTASADRGCRGGSEGRFARSGAMALPPA